MPKQKKIQEMLAPLGLACKEHRFRNQNMNQKALAEKAGVSDPVISGIENNKPGNISTGKLIAVANAVGLNVEISFVAAKK